MTGWPWFGEALTPPPMKIPSRIAFAFLIVALTSCSSVQRMSPTDAAHAGFVQIQLGMSKAEVVALLGEPSVDVGKRCTWETRADANFVLINIRFDDLGNVSWKKENYESSRTVITDTRTAAADNSNNPQGRGAALLNAAHRDALYGTNEVTPPRSQVVSP
jgi:hypothetical protein